MNSLPFVLAHFLNPKMLLRRDFDDRRERCEIAESLVFTRSISKGFASYVSVRSSELAVDDRLVLPCRSDRAFSESGDSGTSGTTSASPSAFSSVLVAALSASKRMKSSASLEYLHSRRTLWPYL